MSISKYMHMIVYIYVCVRVCVCVHLVMFPTRCFAKDLDHHVGKRPARLVLRGLSGLWLHGHHAESRGIFGQRGQLRGVLAGTDGEVYHLDIWLVGWNICFMFSICWE